MSRGPVFHTVFPNIAPPTSDELWDGDCRTNPRLWDGDPEDGETRDEQRVRHLIVARICRTCPMLEPCRRALDAQTEPVSGVWAGVLVDYNGKGNIARPGHGAAA